MNYHIIIVTVSTSGATGSQELRPTVETNTSSEGIFSGAKPGNNHVIGESCFCGLLKKKNALSGEIALAIS